MTTDTAGDGRGGLFSRSPWFLLIPLLLIGLWVRFRGLTFGLPYNYHFDEFSYMIATFTATWESIHPLFNILPGLVLIEHQILQWILPLLQKLPLSPEMEATLTSNMSYHLLARITSAVAGALAAVPLFFIADRLWGRRAAFYAALFMTLCFIQLRSSHYGVPDALVSFLAATAAYFALQISEVGKVRHYLLAGMFTGMAASGKMLAWPLCIVIFLFHTFASTVEGPLGGAGRLKRAFLDWKLYAAAAATVVTLVICSPQWLINPDIALGWWQQGSYYSQDGGFDRFLLDPGGAPATYARALGWGLGLPMAVLAFAGIVLALIRRPRRRALILLVYPALYFAFLLNPGIIYLSHYSIAGLPLLILFAAAALDALVGRLPLTGRAATAAALIAGLLVVAQPAVSTFLHNQLLLKEDTRTLAKHWIEENVPEGSFLALEGWNFGPQLQSQQVPSPFSKRTYRFAIKPIYGLSERATGQGPYKGSASVKAYRKAGVQYLVTNQITSSSRMIDPEQDQAKRDFYASLDVEGERVAMFTPYKAGAEELERRFNHTYGPANKMWRFERPGPIIKVYRIADPPEEAATPEATEASENAEEPAREETPEAGTEEGGNETEAEGA